MPVSAWTAAADVDAFVDGAGSGVIYKHSSACSISAIVRERAWESFLAAQPDVPVYEVLVIEHRDASHRVAERLDVRHESPQAIVVRNGRAIWDASHLRITAEALARAWAGA